MKNVYFFEKFKGILRFFENFIEMFEKNLGKNLENFGNMGLQGVRGAEPPEASENIKKLVEKSMENGKILKLFMKFQRILT